MPNACGDCEVEEVANVRAHPSNYCIDVDGRTKCAFCDHDYGVVGSGRPQKVRKHILKSHPNLHLRCKADLNVLFGATNALAPSEYAEDLKAQQRQLEEAEERALAFRAAGQPEPRPSWKSRQIRGRQRQESPQQRRPRSSSEPPMESGRTDSRPPMSPRGSQSLAMVPDWYDSQAWEFVEAVQNEDLRSNFYRLRQQQAEPVLEELSSVFNQNFRFQGYNRINNVYNIVNYGSTSAPSSPPLQQRPSQLFASPTHRAPASPTRRAPAGPVTPIGLRELRSQFRKKAALWAYETGVAFNTFKNRNMQEACDLQAAFGYPGFKLPTPKELANECLDEAYNDCMEELRTATNDVRLSRFPRPLSLVTDGWKNVNSQHVVNIMIVDATNSRDFFYNSIHTEDTTSEALCELISKEIDSFTETFSSSDDMPLISTIIMDNAPNMRKCGKMLEQRYPRFWSIPCQCHAFNLILTSWNKLRFIKNHLLLASSIVAFVRNHGRVLKIFRDKSRARNSRKELVRPCVTRFASNFLMVKRLVEVQEVLQEVFEDFDYKNWLSQQSSVVKEHAAEYEKAISGSTDFWTRMKAIQNLLEPVFLAIRDFDRTWASIGHVWQAWSNIQASVKAVSGFSSRQRQVLLKILLEREEEYRNCDLFGAAHCLNPRVRQLHDGCVDPNAEAQLYKVVRKLYPGQQSLFDTFMARFKEYLGWKGIFEHNTVADSELRNATQASLDPYTVWVTSGTMATGASILRTVACQVLGLTASNSSAERNFSSIKNVQTAKRNQLREDRVKKLVYIYHNSKLKNRRSRGDSTTKTIRRLFLDQPRPAVAEEEVVDDDDDDDSDVEVGGEGEGGVAEAGDGGDCGDFGGAAARDNEYTRFGDEPMDHEEWEDSDFEGDDITLNRKYKLLQDIVDSDPPTQAPPAQTIVINTSGASASASSLGSAALGRASSSVIVAVPQPPTAVEEHLEGAGEEQTLEQGQLRRSSRLKRPRLR